MTIEIFFFNHNYHQIHSHTFCLLQHVHLHGTSIAFN